MSTHVVTPVAHRATGLTEARAALVRFVHLVLGVIGGALDGFVVGFAVGYLVATVLSGVDRHLGLGPAVDIAATTLATLAVLGLVWGVLVGVIALAGAIRDRLARMLGRSRVPAPVAWLLLAPLRIVAAVPKVGVALMAAILVIAYLVGPTGIGALVTPDGVLVPWLWFTAFTGAAIGVARALLVGQAGTPGRLRRALGLGAGAVAIGIAGWAAWIAVDPGSADYLVRPDPAFDGVAATQTTTAAVAAPDDPGLPGTYTVTAFTYGSGTDRRAAFGTDVLLRTPTVDASRALNRLGGLADEARDVVWGFGPEELPLNARVWMPDGEGPFPLVLVVHGNHAMGAPNEAGYAYLGEHLASRGFITASIDESFLNGSWAGDWKGSEQSVRAWLLLRHLDQWRTWNATPDGPLEGKVDLDRVALIGHSRGGEAASIAAAIANVDGTTNPMLQPWPEGLRIHAVVAIAPSDGQYGRPVRLSGVDLLELSGGHDADARAWSGIRQYNRTTVVDGGFKAAIYAQRANHGQFNTEWGAGDYGRWSGALLNLRPLLPAAEQEDVARTAIGAFLEASVHEQPAYRDFFRRPMAGRTWLPDDVYLVRSDDGRGADLAHLGTNAAAADDEPAIVSEGLARQRFMVLPLRALQGDQEGKATVLEWDAGPGEARWGVTGLAAADVGTDPGSMLELDLANATPVAGMAVPGASLDPLVELTTTDGVSVALPLSTWGALPPPLATKLAKNEIATALAAVGGLDLSLRFPAEQVVQSYQLPLAAFMAADPSFRPERIDEVTLRLPRTNAGAIAVAAIRIADETD